LVRDKIPQIIKKNEGKYPEVKILKDDDEYLKFLLKKIEEESNELANSENKEHLMEELSDVMEIVDEILELNGWTLEKIRQAQKEKNIKRGGFKKRILMLRKV